MRFSLLTFFCIVFLCLNGKNSFAADEDPTLTTQEVHDNFRYKMGEGITYVSDSKNFKGKLSGWLQSDTAFFNSDRTYLDDGSIVRRGRLGFSSQIYHDLHVVAEYDFTKKYIDSSGFQDLYIRYIGIPNTHLTLGNLKEPIGLEWQTSSKSSTFMERSISQVLIPVYHLGFVVGTHGKSWTTTGGVFEEKLTDGLSSNSGWGTAGRVTYSPVHEKNLTLHFGLSGLYRERGSNSSNLSYSSRPESNISNIQFVNTHSIRRVGDYKLTGIEFAGLSGPFSLQAEYFRTFINRTNGRNDLQFDGWYAYASWFVTGESRNYDPQSGRFSHIKPNRKLDFKGGFGAFELATRYSQVDLNDQRINGGSEHNITLGGNWYLNSYLKIMANYIFVQTDANTFGLKNFGREQPQIFEMRAQVEF